MMKRKRISAVELRAHSGAILDEVARTGVEVIVTKRGRPVAKIVGVEEPLSSRGTTEYLVSDEELIAPIDVEWDAEK